MLVVIAIFLIPLIAALALTKAAVRVKGWLAVGGLLVVSAITSIIAVRSLLGYLFQVTLAGGPVFGDITIKADPLSAWFLLLMNFTVLTSAIYGQGYMRAYRAMTSQHNLHWISLLINHGAMTGIYLIHNSLAFLVTWEIMALSAFLLVIFEHWKMETLKAGINYLIQSHLSIAFLMIGFLWVAGAEGNYGFEAITHYCTYATPAAGVLLFIVFLIGFGFKAGFIPLHTWLPYAHPAAPAHISGMMSGVIIKAGIYGILRVMVLANTNWLTMGVIVLIIGVLSGLYGVMLAIVQHNLKRLLAYHSIENIGIIGIGIGIGAIGIGSGNPLVAMAGFSGALLHVLNHSLFKSLLFFGSGIIYQAIHTLNIDSMGGLIRQLPKTALLFLLAALAITGLPPFNGFISEFLIYSGLFKAIHSGGFSYTALFVLSIVGLVLIGGLAMLCFTKAFGIIFLGSPRVTRDLNFGDPSDGRLVPMVMTALLISAIGLFPQFFVSALTRPVAQITGDFTLAPIQPLLGTMQHVSRAAWGFIALAGIVWLIRSRVTLSRPPQMAPTWGCGYTGSGERLQYTASSYVRSYRKLVEPLLKVTRHRPGTIGLVPEAEHFSTHTYDRLESSIVDTPVRKIKGFIGRFNFLQNGSVQFYVLYGILFIFIIIAIPLVINGLLFVYELIKQL